jgi:hypothetical protein
MKQMLYELFILVFLFFSCGNIAAPEKKTGSLPEVLKNETIADRSLIDPSGKILQTRFLLPEGFHRTQADSNSFTAYLRNLPLKPDGSKVKLFDGEEKNAEGVYDAVVDLPIGNKDLHQCADAVMRLRAEYLFAQKQYDRIHFNFTNGFRCDYSEWMKGKRVAVNGNKASWKQSAQPSDTYKDFWNYMETIFSYAGSLSLSKELKSVPVEELQAGDVFIMGGSPGHAIIVVDVAVDPKSNKKIFMLAQSYMPAQETQVLKDPFNDKLSPWYPIDFGETLITPEWTFTRNDLKRFQE